MAAALVGGAFLSSFLNVLFDRLATPEVINWLKGKKSDAEKLLERLETSLLVVQVVLNDAEQRQITEPAVKMWLTKLEDAVYKADDLLDELRTRATATDQKDDAGNPLSDEMMDRIKEVTETLESLEKRKDILGLKNIENVNMSSRIPSTSLVVTSEIFGRDEDRKAIIELLLDDSSDAAVSVIPIVGMGGLGKTTLAQLVYSDDELEGKFDSRAWVCVGEEFDTVKVTKAILIAVTGSPCYKDDFNLLQNDLKDKLSWKKFLIVLDDMWNHSREAWETLKKPFQYGNKGSKILVTARSDKVASVVQTTPIYRLHLLPEQDCWSLFVKHAFHSTDSREFSALEEIGRNIVGKCKGLPLAVKTLGSLLQRNYDVNYWHTISKSDVWQISEDENGIIPALRISYHYLSSHLKRCFVFCSLYPKDHEFDKDELILQWMAEDFFVQPDGIKSLEEIGNECFNELVARSFFQPSNTWEGIFVMHDLMHDLAIFCAGEFYFRDELEKAKEIGKISTKTRHLSHNAGYNYPISNLLAACHRAKHSRTFLEVNLSRWSAFNMEDAPCILLSHLKCLRVLSFNSFPLHSFPHSIGELIHMRYLDLSDTPIVTLPESLSRLYNLQTLKLNGCWKLEMLPSGMHDLVNLRHLDIEGTSLEEMPKGMSRMEHLQFLSDYVVGKHEENKIGELGALVNLHGSLCISNIENVGNVNEVSEALISNKKYVNCLELTWSSTSIDVADSQIERDILDKLQPHQDLKKLSVDGYRGTTFPDWLGYSSYKHMTHLELRGCKNCWTLPSLGQLLSLEALTFDDLKSWQEWHSFEFDDAFPHLKELTIKRCPMLKGNLPSHLPKLEKLNIDWECEKLACLLPKTPAMLELEIQSINSLRMQELPPSIRSITIRGSELIESVFEAMRRTHPACLQALSISDCDSAISFPGDCLPASLQSLQIWNCKKLDFPTQQQQQHLSLQELIIYSSCDSLTSFPLSAFPNLRELELSFCKNMESLVMSQSHNASNSSLRSLTIKGCPKFASLSTLWMAAPQLEYLSIENCPEIESFGVDEGGLPPNLRKLEISGCKKLESNLASMDLRSHGLTRLSIGCESESVKCFPKEGWLPASLESLSLWSFPSLETLDCNGLSHLTSLHTLQIWFCEKLENMTGQTLPASLTHLHIYHCPVLGERCQAKDPQIWPMISHLQIEVDRVQIQ